jgi:prepilin-type N-terminal cleavage/methylation domain-containing protein
MIHTRPAPTRPLPRCSAFTLLELLIVIAIIALLMSILAPALRAAREDSKVVKCITNLRAIGQASAMYMDNDQQPVIPWYQYEEHEVYAGQVQLFTPNVFGGFRAPVKIPEDLVQDSSIYPAQIRPLNAYIDRSAVAKLETNDRGRDIIPLFKCPGDCTYATSVIGHEPTFTEEEAYNSWQINGTSYSLNSRFMQGYVQPSGDFEVKDSPEYAQRIAKSGAFTGGKASRFLFWLEQGFYSAAYRATPSLPNGAASLRMGWHRRFSAWSGVFADGHAQNGFFDTRLIYGMGGTLWEP